MLTLTKKIQNTFSVSGLENSLSDLLRKELEAVADEAFLDPMGNLLVLRKGKDSSKKLMIASHMDEIGFVVTGFTSEGYVRVAPIGGIGAVASAYQKVRFSNGTNGVMIPEYDVKPADLTVKHLVVDIGARKKKEAESKLKVGDLCAAVPSFQKLSGTRYTSKAFDDRIGCVINAYAALHAGQPAYDTWFVFTVQEEVGCRGSKTAAFRIMPDYGIALDVTAADECGDGTPVTKLGKGAAIKIKDRSVLCSSQIIERLTDLAVQKKIPYQYEVLPYGGTDTSSMQMTGAGCAAGCISIPSRYIHSPVETIDYKDLKACADLLIAFIENGIG
ncbi:MAG: M20/M25/M40 family metallo-hydrolase [Clostridia bacterium]|nr:M20/M25/M40 family metallo-hydrolase [Clostridia bacterium]